VGDVNNQFRRLRAGGRCTFIQKVGEEGLGSDHD